MPNVMKSRLERASVSDRETRREPDFEIRPARVADVPVLAALFKEMDYSRLHDLGPAFAGLLFRHIVQSRQALCLVAASDGNVHGYISYALDGRKFTRGFLLRYGWLAALAIAGRMLHPRNFRTVLHCLKFFWSDNPFGDQKVSGLTFAVQRNMNRRGIGRALWQAGNRELRKHGVEWFVFTTAGDPKAPANAFYEKLGCEFLGMSSFYEDSVASLYRCDLRSE